MDLGILTEGVVELDPISGRMVLRIPQDDGSNQFLDIQDCLLRYKGTEVRFILTPLATIEEIARHLQDSEA